MNVTTQFEGNVTVSSPLFTVVETYTIQFVSNQLPTLENSYAIVN